jgi:Undecaprenyl-phosphate glucose phosphotransferase
MIWTHGLIRRLVKLCDLAMLVFGTLVAYAIRPIGTLSQTGLLLALGALIFQQVLSTGGAYRVEHFRSIGRQIRQVTVGGVPAYAAVLIAFWAFIPDDRANIVPLIVWAICTYTAVIFGRLVLVHSGMKIAERRALLRRNVVVLGEAEQVRKVLARLALHGDRLFRIVGLFLEPGPHRAATINDIPVTGEIDELFAFAQDERVDVIIIALPWSKAGDIGRMIERLHGIAADAVVPFSKDEFDPSFALATVVADLPVLQVMRQPLKGSLWLFKVLEDYGVAVVGLMVSLPVLVIAALAIRLETPGPILFRQQRVGFNGKPFMVYKLRTMYVNPSDDGSKGVVREDPRVTRVGAILRRFSIDELPQLLNVLDGDMSVVGPRPHVPNMLVGEYGEYSSIREYASRYRMKPGITGWAQINGMRGGIFTEEKAARGIALDLYYIESWSIWLDFKIIILTITKGMAASDVF